MDKKTLQEIIEWLYSEKEELTEKLVKTTTDTGANRRIGQIDMTMYFINTLKNHIQKLEEEP